MIVRDHARSACGNFFKSGKCGKSGISGKCVTKIFPHEKACVTPEGTFPSPLEFILKNDKYAPQSVLHNISRMRACALEAINLLIKLSDKKKKIKKF